MVAESGGGGTAGRERGCEREQLGERKAHRYFSSKLGAKIYGIELEATSTDVEQRVENCH
jgi:hypothetical protein